MYAIADEAVGTHGYNLCHAIPHQRIAVALVSYFRDQVVILTKLFVVDLKSPVGRNADPGRILLDEIPEGLSRCLDTRTVDDGRQYDKRGYQGNVDG